MDWRPSADEQRAIRSAARSLHLDPTWLWYDDLKQAALIVLHQSVERRATNYPGVEPYAIAYGFARRAMQREWVSLIDREPGTRAGRGVRVEFDPEPLHLADPGPGPEQMAEMRQALQAVERLPDQMAEAVMSRMEFDTMREAADALGIRDSCFESRLYAGIRTLQEAHGVQPVKRPKELKASDIGDELYPTATKVQRRYLDAIRKHGSVAAASAALGVKCQSTREALQTARRRAATPKHVNS